MTNLAVKDTELILFYLKSCQIFGLLPFCSKNNLKWIVLSRIILLFMFIYGTVPISYKTFADIVWYHSSRSQIIHALSMFIGKMSQLTFGLYGLNNLTSRRNSFNSFTKKLKRIDKSSTFGNFKINLKCSILKIIFFLCTVWGCSYYFYLILSREIFFNTPAIILRFYMNFQYMFVALTVWEFSDFLRKRYHLLLNITKQSFPKKELCLSQDRLEKMRQCKMLFLQLHKLTNDFKTLFCELFLSIFFIIYTVFVLYISYIYTLVQKMDAALVDFTVFLVPVILTVSFNIDFVFL